MSRMTRRLSVPAVSTLATLMALTTAAAQQPAPPRDAASLPRGTASISGVVVAEGPQATPIRRVTLTLAGAELGPRRAAVSDDDGRFTFTDLPAGRFTLTGARAGYVPAAYGATRGWRSQGVPIAVAAGQRLDGLSFRMMKGAAITGRVTDELGQPFQGAYVVVGELRTFGGEMRFVRAPGPEEWETDDRGVFRAYGLPPGRFIVSAQRPGVGTLEPTSAALIEWAQSSGALAGGRPSSMPEPPRRIGYVPVYFPGTADPATAASLTLAAGEERAGVDIVLGTVPKATIQGRVTGSSGDAVAGVEVFAFPVGEVAGIDLMGIPPLGHTNAQGGFTMDGVAPGRYTLLAQSQTRTTQAAPRAPRQPPSAAGMLWARADVVVDGRDVRDVALQLQPGAPVSGRVVFENRTGPLSADLRRTTVRIAPPPSAQGAYITLPPVEIGADGAFTIEGVGPGSYLLSVAAPGPAASPAWMITSVTAAGQDLIAMPLDMSPGVPVSGIVVTLTDRVTELSGVLQDAGGRPAPDYFVVAFPADRRLWTLGEDRLRPPARPSSDGRYRIPALLPGEYYLAALTEMQPDDHLDPTFLELLLPSAIRVTIAAGEKKVQDIRLKK